MAGEAKTSFPKLGARNWWALREKFKQSIPSVVDKAYLTSVLNISEASARANVLPPLRMLGLIDDKGEPTDLATKWRDDREYPEVCAEIKKVVYPPKLLTSFPTVESNQSEIERWFMSYSKVGAPAAKMYTSFYRLLLEADPSKSSEVLKGKERKKLPKAEERNAKKKDLESKPPPPGKGVINSKGPPSLHFDIQIHISPDASPEQIDKVFESMARHLKDFFVSS